MMVRFVLALVFFVILVYLDNFKTDAEPLLEGPFLEDGLKYLQQSAKNKKKYGLDPPKNQNSSIGYRVYTRKNPKNPCFLEPNAEALKNCPIDSEYSTMFLIHGFIVEELAPGNLLEVIKDVLLEREALNVIIVDWTKYDQPPYDLAIKNMYTVGGLVAELIKFLVKHAGIQTENVIITGHSLGAHMAGTIGKQLKHLGRIDGLDPAGPGFDTSPVERLSYTDADFVQVIHTSDEKHGFGLHESLGHMDFYVNGGRTQPHCHYGSHWLRPSGHYPSVHNEITLRFCHHEIALSYYINTINSTDCKFLGTKCNSYDEFQDGKCTPDNSVVGKMGPFGSKISRLPPHSNFYLRTGSESPFCLKDGYLP